MILSGIDFPNQIIDAIKDNRLIVFAGAGVSRGKPTSLPDFNELAEVISEGTGAVREKDEKCEVFLGRLEAERKIDVNSLVAEKIEAAKKHNQLHEIIVNIFMSPDNIKIVTTNYDQMFEVALEKYSNYIPIYSAPALPLGDDVQGIVHIHGSVNHPRHMVVTDEAFGRAYITDGYAARFLAKAFESYTILFVGYSYNDTIVRYLSRAMFQKNADNRYILTDETNANWKSLGITAIPFPEQRFDILGEGLEKLGKRCKRGLVEWKDQFLSVAEKPPLDQTIETEIDYCLEDIKKTRIFAEIVSGKEWMDYLDEKKAFESCFSNSCVDSKSAEIWAHWLCEKFVGEDDESLKELIANHDSGISTIFADKLIIKIQEEETTIDNKLFCEYLLLLNDHIRNAWTILMLIETANKRGLVNVSIRLFQKLFRCDFRLENEISFKGDYLDFKHTVLTDYYYAERAWEIIGAEVIEMYPLRMEEFVKTTIEEMHFKYESVGLSSKNTDPPEMAMLVIEEREENKENPLLILNQVYLESCKSLEKDKELFIKIICRNVVSESSLLRKMTLRVLRESEALDARQKIDILLANFRLNDFYLKEQIFLLVRSVFKNLPNDYRDIIIDEIVRLKQEDERCSWYFVYNWCVWLQIADPSDVRSKEIKDKLSMDYNYTPREHPELDFYPISQTAVVNRSPLSEKEMMQQDTQELIELLVSFDGDVFNGPTRWGLMDTLTNCVKNNTSWAFELTKSLFDKKVKKEDVWECLLRGFTESETILPNAINVVELFSEHIAVIPNIRCVANYIFELLKRDEIKSSFSEHEKIIFDLSEKLWFARNADRNNCSRTIDAAINMVQGIVLLSWIRMVSLTEEQGISEKYKRHFSDALMLKESEGAVATCILAGHFNYLYAKDHEWSIAKLSPLLEGNDLHRFNDAWEGVSYFSRTIFKDTADVVAPIFLEAVKNISLLSGEAKSGFIELYLILIIHIADNPLNDYIPRYYNAGHEDDIALFIAKLEAVIRKAKPLEKRQWWEAWLALFLENRKHNKPTELSESECQKLFELLPELEEVLDEAIDLLCEGKKPKELRDITWYSIKEKDLIKKHPRSMAKLLIELFADDFKLGFGKMYVEDCLKDFKVLAVDEKKSLQEALLKQGIYKTIE